MNKIREIKIGELIPDDKNANLGTDRGRELLESSLSEYGAGRSILVDKNLRIIGGNKCIEQAENLNMDDVIVVQSDGSKIIAVQRTDLDLTKDKKARELAYADNRIAEIDLKWDYDQILKDAEVIPIEEWFSKEDLEKIQQAQPQGEEIPEEELNNVPEPKKVAVSKLGDLFLIGKHRVLCGDSTKKEDVERLMDGKKAELCVTDPPYNVCYDYVGIDDNKTVAQYKEFCVAFFENLKTYSKNIIITPGLINKKLWYEIENPHYLAVWTKLNAMTNGVISRFMCTEPILFYGEKWSRKRHSDIFDFPVSNQKDVGNHKCPKPLKLFVDLIENYSEDNNTILDLFLGSGTTLIACEQTGRVAYCCELEPLYIDVSIRRFFKLYPNCEFKHLNGKLKKQAFIEKES